MLAWCLSGARCRLAYGPADAMPLTVSCFSNWFFTFLVPAHLGNPGKRAVKRVCVCVHVWYLLASRTVYLSPIIGCIGWSFGWWLSIMLLVAVRFHNQWLILLRILLLSSRSCRKIFSISVDNMRHYFRLWLERCCILYCQWRVFSAGSAVGQCRV